MSLRDPTRSQGLRRQGRGIVNRKVFDLHKQLRTVLQEYDMTGLRGHDIPDDLLRFIEANSNRLERSEEMLHKVVELTLVSPPDWLRGLIERSVQRGIDQAAKELREAKADLDAREVSRYQTAASVIEVRGIASETERRVMRHVVNAVQARVSPEALMREVRASLEKITRARLTVLVNQAVVTAVNAGKLFAYAENGVRQVGIDPEWIPDHRRHVHDRTPDKDKRKIGRRARSSRTQQRRERVERKLEAVFAGREVSILTAGDDKVCEDCQDIAADGPYDLDTARDLIPAHINCRCAFVPYGDERYARNEEQEDD